MKGSFIGSFGGGLMLALTIAFVASLVMHFSGELVFNESLNDTLFQEKIFSRSFKVTDPKTLFELKVSALFLNSEWVYYGIDIVSEDGKSKVMSIPISLSYYSGGIGEDHWSEGNTDGARLFKLPKGEYKFSIDGEGGTSETSKAGFKT